MRVVALLATVVGLSIIAMLALVVMDVAQAMDQFRQHFQARIASSATATSGSARRRRTLATTASMTVKHGYIEIDCATIKAGNGDYVNKTSPFSLLPNGFENLLARQLYSDRTRCYDEAAALSPPNLRAMDG